MIAHNSLMIFGSIGPWELMLVMVVVLLVFGRRVPEVMKSLGKGVTQFKRGLRDVENEIMSEQTTPETPHDAKQIEEVQTVDAGTKEQEGAPSA